MLVRDIEPAAFPALAETAKEGQDDALESREQRVGIERAVEQAIQGAVVERGCSAEQLRRQLLRGPLRLLPACREPMGAAAWLAPEPCRRASPAASATETCARRRRWTSRTCASSRGPYRRSPPELRGGLGTP